MVINTGLQKTNFTVTSIHVLMRAKYLHIHPQLNFMGAGNINGCSPFLSLPPFLSLSLSLHCSLVPSLAPSAILFRLLMPLRNTLLFCFLFPFSSPGERSLPLQISFSRSRLDSALLLSLSPLLKPLSLCLSLNPYFLCISPWLRGTGT